jgi:uncharacterized protein YndB with AHSA1/START domain
VRRAAVHLDVDPEVAWRLYSRPDQWRRWAPHVLGAWRLSGIGGEVREGARGVVMFLGMPVPIRILGVKRGERWGWGWANGLARFDHIVEPSEHGGCVVALEMRVPPVLEHALAINAPLATAALRNMGRVAADAGHTPP